MGKYRKQLITALKLAISAALVYFILTKIDIGEVLDTLKKTKPQYVLLAIFFFVLSKVLAAFRLNLYFDQLKVHLTQQSNMKLYVLGMFYNLFLPGGIGGDAYKGYLIKKRFGVKTKKVVAVLLLDRLSGLLLLFLYACVLAMVLDNANMVSFRALFACIGLLAIIVFWLLNKRFFHYVFPIFWRSFGYSALVQLAQLVSVIFILKALSIAADTLAYLFIFLVSSIVSVLPLTIGGIGSREVTFYYGADFLGLDVNTAVGISMVFFIITALVSLFGLIYHFKKPELKVVRDSTAED